MSSSNLDSPPSPPPWEVIILIGQYLDPKALAAGSCVCKSWSISMSSDHLWQPIFSVYFPSLSNIVVSSTTAPPIPFRRLFSICHNATARRRRIPLKPLLSLSDLVFAVSVSVHKRGRTEEFGKISGSTRVHKETQIICCSKPGSKLEKDPNGLFKFDINLTADSSSSSPSLVAGDAVKVTWNVVLDGWRGVFTMIECGGKMGFAPRVDGWFSEELPAPGCCLNTVTGGVVADLKLGICSIGRNGDGEEVIGIDNVSVGILSIVNWRYISEEDGLRYLQHFLLK